MSSEAPDAAAREQARSAGRGGLALTAGKLYFLALGLVQQIALSWLLKDGYGALRGALSPASITYNPLIAGGIQGMSRGVSRAEQGSVPASLRAALGTHALVAGVTALGFFLLAPWLGAWLHSEHLVPALRWMSLGVFGYGLYAPLVGVLNGQRRFGLQAGLDVLAATLRTLALFVGAWFLLEKGTATAVAGAGAGFGVVTLVMVGVAALLARVKWKGTSRPGFIEQLRFIAPVLWAQVMLNLLLQADTNTLRAFAARAAENSGMNPESADALVAAYNAAQLFGFLPYQVLMGISFVLFPLLTRAHLDEDREAVRRYTEAGLRIALIITGAVVVLSAGLAESLLRFVFPPSFAELGRDAMPLLCIGLGGFALFGMLTTVLNSLGRPASSMWITKVALAGVVALNVVLVRPLSFGKAMLEATALATSLGVLLGLGLAAIAVWRVTQGLLRPTTLLRTLAVATLCIVAARQLPVLGRGMTLLACLGLLTLYVALLALTKELGKRDLEHLRSIVRRGG